MNFYNDIDPNVCAWTQELVRAGLIPPGDVVCKPIQEIRPDELKNYDQCHFFNGISGWALAAQLAGIESRRSIWFASCPCQPFSRAGKGLAQADELHLWPDFMRLVRECRPDRIIGEQVASAIGFGWLDGISADLEAEGYACGSVVLGAHSIGAPHKRQRLYWVANDQGEGRTRVESECPAGFEQRSRVGNGGATDALGNSQQPGLEGHTWNGDGGHQPGRQPAGEAGSAVSVGNAAGDKQRRNRQSGESIGRSSPNRGSSAWSDFRIIHCRDGKGRRIPNAQSVFQQLVDVAPAYLDTMRNLGASEAEIEEIWQSCGGYPLAGKIPGRVMLLKGAGNCIVPELAAEFIKAAMNL